MLGKSFFCRSFTSLYTIDYCDIDIIIDVPFQWTVIDNETSIHLSTTSKGLNIQSIYVAMGICPHTA